MHQEKLTLFDNEKQEGYLTGEVVSIFFEAPASLYKVALVEVKKTDLEFESELVTITGNFPELFEGTSYYFTGRIVEHQKYGLQFQVLTYKPEILSSKAGVVAYLASDRFPGIGEKTAQKIVASLGENAIESILKDPACIDDLALSKKQKEILLTGVNEDNGAEQVLISLSSLGFSDNMATKIFEKYREKTLEILHENPYQLVSDIEGFGFNRADQVANKLGFAADSEVRITAALYESLAQLSLFAGNTYTDAKNLLTMTLELLEKARPQKIAPELLADQLLKLGRQGKVVSDEGMIYLKNYYDAEYVIAEELKRLLQYPLEKLPIETKLEEELRKIERDLAINYGDDQKQAIKAAVSSPVFLLTGGPGTGKTTIIMGIVRLFAYLNDLDLTDVGQLPIVLAAPTGRAAKKMSDATGLPASTLHRLLGLNGREENLAEEAKQLVGQLLIVDETSMVDTMLLKTLLESVPAQMQVIFVGDKNQLPSVGPGQVFSDMLASETLPKKELEKIYRQGDGSTIISLAHDVKEGTFSPDFLQKTSDRSFIACHAAQVKEVTKQVISAALKKDNKEDDIQVLAPMYRGEAGIDNLNRELQALLNPLTKRKKELISGKNTFRIGDRVLHLVNDPENNVFNGDIGKVVSLELNDTPSPNDKVIVAFDGQEVTFLRKDLRNLTLAYCMSIHKSQGSEFPIVILPLVKQYMRMFARNLLYTAMTRAKDKLILLGEPEAYAQCIKTIALDRKTSLTKRLREIIEVSPEAKQDNVPKFILTNQLIQAATIDPMIGMDGITPLDYTTKKVSEH